MFQLKNVQFSQQNVPVLTYSEPEIKKSSKGQSVKRFALFQKSVTEGVIQGAGGGRG